MIAAENTPGLSTTNFLYSAWTDFGTNTVVNFNRSTNQGASFSQPITLKNGSGQGTNVQTGPNGEIYVCYADYGATTFTLPASGLGFVRSLDGGVTFSAARVAVSYVGIRKSNGGDAAFNNIRVNDFPAMAVDKSGFSRNGRIYAVFAAQQNGNGKAVIQITSSDNRGDTWTTPREISIANGIQSFMPWVCVDQNTGTVYVAYYSIDGSNFQTNTYLAISNDGGTTFTNQKVSDVPHTTQPINNTIFANGYAGDYIGVTAAKGSAFVAWMDNRNGTWQIYVSRVDNLPVITGNNAFCSTSQFTVSNIDPTATVIWSTLAGGIISVSSTGNPVTATKVSQGNVTLTATVYGFLTASVNITTIPQVSSIDYSMNGPCNGSIQTWFLNANPNMAGATNWNWTVDNPSSGIYIYNPNSQSTFADVSGGGGISVTYVNACGETSQRNGVTIYSNCPKFALSPNPASSQVTISPVSNSKGVSVNNGNISGINIYDLQGNLYNHILCNGVKTATVNVSSLISGTYVIEIISQTNGINKEKQLLSIVR